MVVICGGGSGSGKTALAEALLAQLPGWAAMKITPTELYSGITVEEARGPVSDKDTARFLRAGASPVLHVRAPREELEDVLGEALGQLSPEQPLLIEGRGAMTVLRADLTVFVWRPTAASPKTDAVELAATTDIVVLNRAAPAGVEGGKVPELALAEALNGCLAPAEADRTAERVLERFRRQGVV